MFRSAPFQYSRTAFHSWRRREKPPFCYFAPQLIHPPDFGQAGEARNQKATVNGEAPSPIPSGNDFASSQLDPSKYAAPPFTPLGSKTGLPLVSNTDFPEPGSSGYTDVTINLTSSNRLFL